MIDTSVLAALLHGTGAAATALIRIAVAVALLLGAALPARADMFEVRNVAVDVTAETADQARLQAFAAAERQAFDRLVERLVAAEARAGLAGIDAAAISNAVLDLSVSREKVSATRYIGDFTVRFRPDGVRSLLARKGVALMVRKSPPVVVLPIYRNGATAALWDDPNPWRDAWDGTATSTELVPLVLPEVDLGDIATISADQALAGDRAGLTAIAGRYNTTDVLVAVAVATTDPQSGAPALTLEVHRYSSGTVTPILGEIVQTGAEAGAAGLFAAAVKRVGAAVDAAWRGNTTVDLGGGEPAVLAVAAPITALADWIEIQKRLNGNPAVRKVDVVRLTRNEVRLHLHYVGALQPFGLTLEQSGLTLIQSDQDWTLSLAAGPAAGAN